VENVEEREKLKNILFILLYHLRIIACFLLPFFPQKMYELMSRIGVPYDESKTLRENIAREVQEFTITEKGNPLYMRIATEK
jgi:methionyl-tRNA synthetase